MVSVGPPGDDGDRAPPIVAIVGVSSPSKRFADRGPTRRSIDRARSQLPRPSHARGDPRHARPRAAGSSRRSWPATCATGSRRASTAATSSRPTSTAGSCASSAIRTGWSPSARRSSRSALLALIEAGGIAAFDLEPAELAVLASSHSGEDMHVRTLQAIYRRSGVSQALLACGSEGAPLDALTAARLARDGEKAGPGPAHVLGPAHRLAPAVAAPRLGPDRLLDAEPPLADRLPRGGGHAPTARRPPSCGPRSTAAASRRTPSRCARSRAPTRCWPIPRRSGRTTREPSSRGSLVDRS